MKRNKDWTENIANKLRTGSDKAPDRIWDTIQRDMVKTPVSRDKNIRKWVAYTSGIAALVALVLTLSIALHKEPVMAPGATVVKKAIARKTNDITEPAVKESAKKDNRIKKNNVIADNIIAGCLTHDGEIETICTDSIVSDKNTGTDSACEAEKIHENQTESYSKDIPYHFEREIKQSRSIEKSGNRWSLGVSGSALAIASNNSSSTGKMFDMPSHTLKPDNGDLTTTPGSTYYKYEHSIPINIGLSATFGIGHGLQIGTGINYTFLHSRAIAAIDNRSIDQKLHMIGIPVGLTWSFVNLERFSSYIGVEAMGEKCVYASFGDKKVTENGLQFSVSGIVGVQYRILSNFAVYAEPKITHYFTDTNLRTIRTDKNILFNIQFGLRLTY